MLVRGMENPESMQSDGNNMRALYAEWRAAEECQRVAYKRATEMLERANAARDVALEADIPIDYLVQEVESWNVNARTAHQDYKEAVAGADVIRKQSREQLKQAKAVFDAAMEKPSDQTEMDFKLREAMDAEA